uniref:Cytochrome b n=1 Tax=Steinernema glaseri TaxID=37863 RepID=A0A1I7ZZM8_9BILA
MSGCFSGKKEEERLFTIVLKVFLKNPYPIPQESQSERSFFRLLIGSTMISFLFWVTPCHDVPGYKNVGMFLMEGGGRTLFHGPI